VKWGRPSGIGRHRLGDGGRGCTEAARMSAATQECRLGRSRHA
jgi:hypothetical protein